MRPLAASLCLSIIHRCDDPACTFALHGCAVLQSQLGGPTVGARGRLLHVQVVQVRGHVLRPVGRAVNIAVYLFQVRAVGDRVSVFRRVKTEVPFSILETSRFLGQVELGVVASVNARDRLGLGLERTDRVLALLCLARFL
mgnify:CR=1 FL=1